MTWMQSSFLPWSLAPREVVISLDHTDGVKVPGLDHVAHRGDGVLLRVILHYVIRIRVIRIIPATYKNNGPSSIKCQLDFRFKYSDRLEGLLRHCLGSWAPGLGIRTRDYQYIPNMSTRSLMFAALSPLIGRGSLAPDAAQLPSIGSKVSVESESPDPVNPPVTRNI